MQPSYGFELYTRSIARRCTQAISRKFGPADEIEAVWILRDPFCFWPNMLQVRHRGVKGSLDEEMSFEPSREGSDLPTNLDDPDPVLNCLLEEYPPLNGRCDLRSPERLPGLLLHLARMQTRNLLRRELAERGFHVPSPDRFFFTTYDDAGEIRAEVTEKDLLRRVQDELRRFPADPLFFALLTSTCYAGVPERLTFLSWLEQHAVGP